MLIGELSRRTGVPERLLRYYEKQGLLHPGRTPAGYREYAEGDVRAVHRIRDLLAAGLNTANIALMLPCLRDDGARMVPTCPTLVADLHRERARIRRAIDGLNASMDALDAVISAAPDDVAARARSMPQCATIP
ncbi:MerR family transcriptional regulator [Streptomyces avicenniae]|uniref:MerR family transcriptional regulator n=1 Tax=Streptomyces avicenniae TaxID=500153 RepID=UPI000699995E|nr:MerR family transcriptional regulator [Streptomyces avicenniae]